MGLQKQASFMNCIVGREALADILDKAYAEDESLDNQQLAIAFVVLAIGASMDFSHPPCEAQLVPTIDSQITPLARGCSASRKPPLTLVRVHLELALTFSR